MIWGTRHIMRRRLAFRNDYCRTCKKPVRAERVRSLWFLTVFFVPILPLGVRRRWLCGMCKFPVHAAPAFGGMRKLVLAVILTGVAIAAWQEDLEGADEHPVLHAVFIGVLTLAPGWLFVSAFQHRHDPSLEEGLRTVAETEDEICPYCVERLLIGSAARCPKCGVTREPSTGPKRAQPPWLSP